MTNLNLTNDTSYVSAYTLASIDPAKSLVITNNTGKAVEIVHTDTGVPANNVEGFVLQHTDSSVINSKAGYVVYVRGHGSVSIQELIGAILPYQGVDLPQDLYTSSKQKIRRLRVDIGQTGFFDGREFRSFKELSIPQGGSVVVRYTAVKEFILFNQELEVDAGAVRMTAYAGATATGTFTEPLPIVGKNRMLERPQPYYTAANSIDASTTATLSGGSAVEIVRVVAANSNAQQQSVGGGVDSERGLPAGVYYVKFENISNSTATGVYSLFWEERL